MNSNNGYLRERRIALVKPNLSMGIAIGTVLSSSHPASLQSASHRCSPLRRHQSLTLSLQEIVHSSPLTDRMRRGNGAINDGFHEEAVFRNSTHCISTLEKGSCWERECMQSKIIVLLTLVWDRCMDGQVPCRNVEGGFLPTIPSSGLGRHCYSGLEC